MQIYTFFYILIKAHLDIYVTKPGDSKRNLCKNHARFCSNFVEGLEKHTFSEIKK